MEEIIDETTVALLSGIRVGVANIGRGEFTLPDGTTKTGLSASLFFNTDDEREEEVGQGSIVEIGGTQWKVTKVKKPLFGGRGSITMETVE